MSARLAREPLRAGQFVWAAGSFNGIGAVHQLADCGLLPWWDFPARPIRHPARGGGPTATLWLFGEAMFRWAFSELVDGQGWVRTNPSGTVSSRLRMPIRAPHRAGMGTRRRR